MIIFPILGVKGGASSKVWKNNCTDWKSRRDYPPALRLASRARTALRARSRRASASSLVCPPESRPSSEAIWERSFGERSMCLRISLSGMSQLSLHFGQVVFMSLLVAGNPQVVNLSFCLITIRSFLHTLRPFSGRARQCIR